MLNFLKLGGSLITDKNQARTARPEVIQRLCEEIRQARIDHKQISLVLGHGSGSFGHVAAKEYGTRGGVRTPEEWIGFVEVWRQARDLNNLVLDALRSAGLLAIAFPPSAVLQARQGKPVAWNFAPLRSALAAGLIPVVNGDVAFDETLGGTIVSTEDVFHAMAGELKPERILLCGLEEGIWQDYPLCTELLPVIDNASASEMIAAIHGSASVDVTGGMVEKVRLMLSLISLLPDLQVTIFSGIQPGNLYRALSGERLGTLICRDASLLD